MRSGTEKVLPFDLVGFINQDPQRLSGTSEAVGQQSRVSAPSALSSARSRHSDSRHTGTFVSQDTFSKGSPRSRRCTTASYLFAENRSGGPDTASPSPAFWARAGTAVASVTPDSNPFFPFMLYLRLYDR